MRRLTLVFVSALPLLGCSSETGNSSMAESYLCGHKVGYNMLISDATKKPQPLVVKDVTSGSVVAIQVAPCGRGVTTELDPQEGSGKVVKRVQDSEGRDVGLVIAPVSGKALQVVQVTPSGRTVIAIVNVLHL